MRATAIALLTVFFLALLAFAECGQGRRKQNKQAQANTDEQQDYGMQWNANGTQVCPGKSGQFMSCQKKAHRKFRSCMRELKEEPNFRSCSKRQDIKEARDRYTSSSTQWHKRFGSCFFGAQSAGRRVREAVDEPTDEEDIAGAQCFTEAQRKVETCIRRALKCPKFKQCYESPDVSNDRQSADAALRQYRQLFSSCLQEDL